MGRFRLRVAAALLLGLTLAVLAAWTLVPWNMTAEAARPGNIANVPPLHQQGVLERVNGCPTQNEPSHLWQVRFNNSREPMQVQVNLQTVFAPPGTTCSAFAVGDTVI